MNTSTFHKIASPHERHHHHHHHPSLYSSSKQDLPASVHSTTLHKHYLEYGMIVSIGSTGHENPMLNGCLAGEGFAEFGVHMEPFDPINTRSIQCHFRDCLFEIVPKQAYDATQELMCYLDREAYTSEPLMNLLKKENEKNDPAVMAELRLKCDAENRLNQVMRDKLWGTRVKYGEVVQLRHIKSKKYITVDTTAVVSSNSFKIFNTSTSSGHVVQVQLTRGCARAHFHVLPRFKLRQTGDDICLSDKLVFSNEFHRQHFALSVLPSAELCAHTGTSDFPWTASLYDDNASSSRTHEKSGHEAMMPLRFGTCIRLRHLETRSWLCVIDQTLTLESSTDSSLSSDNPPSYSLWELESKQALEGGDIGWNEKIKLRHLCTGQYLTCSRSDKEEENNVRLSLRASSNSFTSDQIFSFHMASVEQRHHKITNDSIMGLYHPASDTFVHVHMMNHAVLDIRARAEYRDEDCFRFVSVESQEVEDTLLLLSLRPVLERALEHIRDAKYLNVRHLRKVERTLSDLIGFCTTDEQPSGESIRSRQELFRFQGYIELLIELLRCPFQQYAGRFSMQELKTDAPREHDLHEDVDAITSTNEDNHNAHNQHPLRHSQMSPSTIIIDSLRHILRLTNVLLTHIFHHYRENELRVIQSGMSTLLDLLGNGFGTSIPLSQLLKENRDLVETLDVAIISRFIQLIGTHGKSIRYLEFLIALCRVGDRGILKMQNHACRLICREDQSIFFRTKMITGVLHVCIEQREDDAYHWPFSNSEPVKWIPLSSFFEYYPLKTSRLGRYFQGQVQLMTAMCLGRNLVSIETIRPAFPRSVLLSSLMNSSVPGQVRLAMSGLLSALYIDVMPRRVCSVPNVTRIWKNLHPVPMPKDKRGENDPGEEVAFFEKLKSWIERDLAQRAQDRMSSHHSNNATLLLALLKLIRTLTEFGMYNTLSDMKAIVPNLVMILDGRPSSCPRSSLSPTRNLGKEIDTEVSAFALRRKDSMLSVQSFDDQYEEEQERTSTQTVLMMDEQHEPRLTSRRIIWNSQSMKKQALSQMSFRSCSSSMSTVFNNDHDHRYERREDNLEQIQMKEEICAILLYLSKLSLDDQISSVLMQVKAQVEPQDWRRVSWSSCFDQLPHSVTPLMQYTQQPREPYFPHSHVHPHYELQSPYGLNSILMAANGHRHDKDREVRIEPILLDCMMYHDSPVLVAQALALFYDQFNQHERLVQALSQVQVLVSPEAIHLYHTLVQDTTLLGQLANMCQTWIDGVSQEDLKRAEDVCIILSRLNAKMYMTWEEPLPEKGEERGVVPNRVYGSGIVSVDSIDYHEEEDTAPEPQPQVKPRLTIVLPEEAQETTTVMMISSRMQRYFDLGIKPYVESSCLDRLHLDGINNISTLQVNREIRRLIQNLHSVEHVFRILRTGCFHAQEMKDQETKTKHKNSPQNRQDMIRKVIAAALTLCCSLCRGNHDNQVMFATECSMFLEYFAEFHEAQNVCALVYASSRERAHHISLELLHLIINRLILTRLQGQAHLLYLLEHVVQFEGQAIVSNQLVVLKLMTNPVHARVMLQGFEDVNNNPLELEKLILLMSSSSTPEEPQDQEENLEVHIRLLHLFSACARGSNVYLKSKCQSLLSFSTVMKCLLAEHGCALVFQYPLLRFLREVYFHDLWLNEGEEGEDEDHRHRPSFDRAPQVSSVLELLGYFQEQVPKWIFQYIQEQTQPTDQPLLKTNNNDVRIFLFRGLLPTLGQLLLQGHVFSTAIMSPDGHRMCQVLFEALFVLVYACAHAQWLEPEVLEMVYSLVQELERALGSNELKSRWRVYTTRLEPPYANVRAQMDLSPTKDGVEDMHHRYVCLRQWMLRQEAHEASQACAAKEKGRSRFSFDFPDRRRSGQSSCASPRGLLPQGTATAGGPVRPFSVHGPSNGPLRSPTATSPRSPPHGPLRSPTVQRSSIPPSSHAPSASRQLVHHWYSSWKGASGSKHALVRKLSQLDESGRDVSTLDGFLLALLQNEAVDTAMANEFHRMLEWFMKGPNVHHHNNTPLAFEELISRLMRHVRVHKTLEAEPQNLMLLDAFVQMIHLGSGTIESRHHVQCLFDRLGATELVIELLSSSPVDHPMFFASIELAIALLSDMNAQVQAHFYTYWTSVGNNGGKTSNPFFERLRQALVKASDEAKVELMQLSPSTHSSPVSSGHPSHSSKHKRRSNLFSRNNEDGSGRNSNYHIVSQILRLLQLFCEGHYSDAQTYLITQVHFHKSINLVECTITYLLEMYTIINAETILLMIQIFSSLAEFCQGPCLEAQDSVGSVQFVTAVNTLLLPQGQLMNFGQLHPELSSDIRELRHAILVTVLSLFDGRGETDVLYDQLLTELSLESLKENLVQVYQSRTKKKQDKPSRETSISDKDLMFGFHLYILMQHMMNYDPACRETLKPKVLWTATSRKKLMTWSELKHWWQAKKSTSKKKKSKIRVTKEEEEEAAAAWMSGYAEAYSFFDRHCARVEIIWTTNSSLKQPPGAPAQGIIQKLIPFYFPIPPMCLNLTLASKQEYFWNVRRDSSRLLDFLNRAEDLMHEMQHQHLLRGYPILARLSRQGKLMRRLAFGVAVILNFVILFCYEVDEVEPRPHLSRWPDVDASLALLIRLLSQVQVVLSSLVMLCFLITSAPLIIKKQWQKRSTTKYTGDPSSYEAKNVHNEKEEEVEEEEEGDPEDSMFENGILHELHSGMMHSKMKHQEHQQVTPTESIQETEQMLREFQSRNDFHFIPTCGEPHG